ncbi:hypothetical protein CP913_23190 [Pseudomonas aeruginosa]|uniref:hypothetical protein n=1 Tax=Pseudomonas aeruginosa TaxID=287 RepID=UPI000BC7485F|nr:hypothetical protein [Pseudomonas aeruginosa]AXN27647.1 hypothetical protein CP913_23190 [Pseudomonas aeruginosa]PCM97415.1 hypothetical protein CP916_15540 [Pseudomonas aeruginosa]PCN02977.1 hypothetical protein CP915_19965 [Pseudomonas aeruginosa]PCN13967.1 hypothetical protein CP914_20355 [Pseudomonas aeruginosa]UFM90665.1 hypothetical protein LO758_06650 [Pseudomonas aeruginosa]
MNRVPVLFAIACLLAGCGRPQAFSVDALAADPARLHALHGQCMHGQHDAALCTQVEQANSRRFFSGRVGRSEYQTLADLPPIPASFDGPSESTAQRP